MCLSPTTQAHTKDRPKVHTPISPTDTTNHTPHPPHTHTPGLYGVYPSETHTHLVSTESIHQSHTHTCSLTLSLSLTWSPWSLFTSATHTMAHLTWVMRQREARAVHSISMLHTPWSLSCCRYAILSSSEYPHTAPSSLA